MEEGKECAEGGTDGMGGGTREGGRGYALVAVYVGDGCILDEGREDYPTAVKNNGQYLRGEASKEEGGDAGEELSEDKWSKIG